MSVMSLTAKSLVICFAGMFLCQYKIQQYAQNSQSKLTDVFVFISVFFVFFKYECEKAKKKNVH